MGPGFPRGVAAEFFQSAAGKSKRNHGFGRDASRRNYTNVGAFISRTYGLARSEIDGLQRAPQGGDRLQVGAHAGLLPGGNAPFESARVIARTGKCCETWFGDRVFD